MPSPISYIFFFFFGATKHLNLLCFKQWFDSCNQFLSLHYRKKQRCEGLEKRIVILLWDKPNHVPDWTCV